MNNEPVAWMVNEKAYADIFEAEHYSKFTNKPMISLYTHPADLTDEEITDIASTLLIATDAIEYEWGVCVTEFARAILRKAQEK